jgi:uncharacterized protein
MLDFKPLKLEDKQIFDKYLKPYNFLTSEYSFNTLFIWRKACDIQYTLYHDVLIIKKMDFNGKYHFMQPIGYTKDNLKHILDMLVEYKNTHKLDFLFKDIEAPFVDDLKELFGDKFEVIEDRDNFDYLYNSDKLKTLSGKKLHAKKNHYNNFVKNNVYKTVPITDEVINDCIKTAREWCNQNDCKGYLFFESRAIEEMLKNQKALDFVGMAVYVKEKLAAFAIGEKVNEQMAIVHIEKADTSVNGLYAFVNKSFVEHYLGDVPLINREQDLGIEGLRKAKLSYHPDKLEAKYIVKDLVQL